MMPPMNERVRAIVEEARKLSPQERLELFDLLEATFAGDEGDGTPEKVEAAWLKEVEERVARVERGEAVLVDYEDVMARARRRIR
jgi:putative addiction module component